MAAASALPKRKQPSSAVGRAKNPLFRVLNEQIFLLAGKRERPKVSSHSQLLAILFISSQTLSVSHAPGDPAPEWSRPLTLAEFALKMGVARNSAWRVLIDAEERGLIESVGKSDAKRPTELSKEQIRGLDIKWGAANPQAKRYRVCPENWKDARPYEPPKIADEEPEPVEPEPVEPEPVEPEPVEPEPVEPEPVRASDLKPGRPWMVPMDKPSDKCYVTNRAGNFQVRVETRFRENALFLEVFVAAKQVNDRTVSLYVDGQKSGNTPPPVLKPVGPFAEHASAAEIGRGLASLEPPLYLDRPTASQTARQLSCPVSFFLKEASARVERAAKSGKPVTTGFVSILVQNANEKWQVAGPAEKARFERLHEAETQAATQARLDSFSTARAILAAKPDDPLNHFTDSDREWARQILLEQEAS